jgi:hypothetical protein
MAFSAVKYLQPGPARITSGTPIFQTSIPGGTISPVPRAVFSPVSSPGGGNVFAPSVTGAPSGSAASGVAFSSNNVPGTPFGAGPSASLTASGSPVLLIVLAVLAIFLLGRQ